MTIKEVQICFGALDQRERLIAKLAILAGMRPGEIFALTWGRLTATYADIRQRVHRRKIDTPKTDNSTRQAALSEGLLGEIEAWRMVSMVTCDDAWVFPSERMTPLSKDNWWIRVMRPVLKKVGLEWATFQVMRRTNATLNESIGSGRKACGGSAWAYARCEPKRLHPVFSRNQVGDREPDGEKDCWYNSSVQTVFRMKIGSGSH
jgi:integrase